MSKHIIILTNRNVQDEVLVKASLIDKKIKEDHIHFVDEADLPELNDEALVISMDDLKQNIVPYAPDYFFIKPYKVTFKTQRAAKRWHTEYGNIFNKKLSDCIEAYFKYEEQGHELEDAKRKLKGLITEWQNFLRYYFHIYEYNKAKDLLTQRITFLTFYKIALMG